VESFLSVGIDIGTTSTHLVVSRLHFDNSSAYSQAPKLEILRKEIIHQGAVRFTPLSADGSIDAEAVAQIIAAEYACAGLVPGDIRAGAIIVTGESAELRNAQAVANELSRFAGDFVCASAGPNHEAALAARGSGAWEASRSRGKTICNVDIGGGTVNAAVIASGQLIDTAAMAIGARFIRLDDRLRVLSITSRARQLLGDLIAPLDLLHSGGVPTANSHSMSSNFQAGDREEVPPVMCASLLTIVDVVAQCILQFLTTAGTDERLQSVMLTNPLQLDRYTIDQFWFTGGVGELMAVSQSETSAAPIEPARYGDAGVVLASSLVKLLKHWQINYLIPTSPIRATVIGAGMHSVQLSGATIDAAEDVLPVTNVPLVRLDLNSDYTVDRLRQQIESECSYRDHDWQRVCMALFIETLPDTSFDRLKQLSMDIAQLVRDFNACAPHIIVLKQDAAAALGMLLRAELNGRSLIVIDGIEAADGDYIDIGKPIVHSQLGTTALALPVVIKTIIFRN